eukprot:m.24539 g.24539  ORF g.24539 m.24539 type:complete len:183 (-) comp11524_c0_seq1:707-1255(-)
MPRAKFSADERRLMNIHKASTPTSTYLAAAAVVSLIPILLFSRIMVLDLISNSILFVVFAAIATAALTFAYQNTARKCKDEFARKTGAAVRAVASAEYAEAKKANNKPDVDLDTFVVERQSEVSENESCFYAICYINAWFMFWVVVLAFYIFRSFGSEYNYGLSVTFASGLVALFSTGKASA